MDFSLEEESGIPFLRNGEEIPVHSTPIKGDKVPLPSTRHVAKFFNQRARRRTNQDDTDTESIRSVQSAEIKESKERHDGCQRLDMESGKHVTHKPPYPKPDRVLDISNQDNLRPKLGEFLSQYTVQSKYDEKPSQNLSNGYEVGDPSGNSTPGNMKDSSQQPQSGPALIQDESQNAFSNYRHFQKRDRDMKVTVDEESDDEVSYSVQISHTNSPRSKTQTGHRSTSPNRHTVEIGSVTKNDYREETARDRQHYTFNSSSYDSQYSKQNTSYRELETNTITRQRQEVQLLVKELKARDQELSDTLATHQQQLLAWEQDRTRLASLEKKIHQLEDELHNKSSKLRGAILSLTASKSREADSNKELERLRTIVDALGSEKRRTESELEKNQIEVGTLRNHVDNLSSRLGHFQAQETELNSIIKSKEKDISYATGQLKELSGRLQQLDLRCKECQDREKEALKEKDHWKNKCEDTYMELLKTTEELKMKTNQCARVLEDNWSARNQLSLVQKESGEREKCKDEFIESMRVKQERTDKQLKGLRELYEHQLNEMAELQKQVDAFRDIMEKQQISMDHIQLSQSDRSSVFTLDHSRNKHHINSPQGRQTQRHRETDTSHYTQSSGYQSQLFENQTGINAGGSSQFVPSIQSNMGYHQLNTESSESSDGIGSKTNVQVATSPQHGQCAWQVTVETNHGSGTDKIRNESSPSQGKSRRRSVSPQKPKPSSATSPDLSRRSSTRPSPGHSDAASSPKRRSSVSPPKQQTNGTSRRSSVRAQEQNEVNTSAERMRRNDYSPASSQRNAGTSRGNGVRRSFDEAEANCSTDKNRRNLVKSTNQHNDSIPFSSTRRTSVTPHHQQQHTDNQSTDPSSPQRVVIKHTSISMYPNENEPSEDLIESNQSNSAQDSAKVTQTVDRACTDIEKEFMFENKLRSFLEDIDPDYDDSIWEDKPDRSHSISGVDSSPSSKLAKLLLESRMMIDSLEKSTDKPQKSFRSANDTLEKPNLDESKNGSNL